MKRFLIVMVCFMLAMGSWSAVAEDVQIGYINEDTKIYMDASENAIVDGSASLGSQVRVEEERVADGMGWYRVTFLASQKTGWVKSDDVDLVIAKKAIKAAEPAPAPGGGVQKVTDEKAFPVLTASGAVDPDTLPGAPKASQYQPIEVGDTGDAVDAVKQRLAALGFLESASGKKFTKEHQSAIKRFQKANDLTQDGLCTPELQARLFSRNALNNKGKKLNPTDPLTFSNGSVKALSNGGCNITVSVKNTSGQKIDAFDYTLRLYNTYGERFLFANVYSEVTLAEELIALDSSEERANLSKNQSIQLGMKMSGYYFAGCMIAVTAYHIEGGDTVRISEDQRHWFAFGKGVPKDYQDLLVTPLTEEEQKQAKAWSLGVSGAYIDPEIAKQYAVREGFMVTSMEPGSLMDAAGLKTGDVLLVIGDVRVFGGTSLERAKTQLAPGARLTVLFLRNGSVYQTELAVTGDEASV